MTALARAADSTVHQCPANIRVNCFCRLTDFGVDSGIPPRWEMLESGLDLGTGKTVWSNVFTSFDFERFRPGASDAAKGECNQEIAQSSLCR
jgi:hypothetical protein